MGERGTATGGLVRGVLKSASVVSTTSVVSAGCVVSGAVVAGSATGAVSNTVSTTLVDVLEAERASISSGVCTVVVGVVAIVTTTSVLRAGGIDVVDVEAAFGGSSVLSVPSESPPLVSTMATIAMARTAAAPATTMIDRDSFHHGPVGSSYPHAISGDSVGVVTGRIAVVSRPLTVVELAHDLNP